MADNPGAVEEVKDFGSDASAKVGRWLAEIKAYEKTFDSWFKRAERSVKRYRNEANADADGYYQTQPAEMNIHWSNIQTLQPALYSRVPKADITRRHKDRNAPARTSAIVLERSVRQEMENGGFDDAMRAVRDDYLLTARGTAWVRYVPTYGDETRDRIFLQEADTEADAGQQYQMPDGSPLGDGVVPQFDDDDFAYIEDGEPYKPVVSECVKIDHVPWRDFGHTPAPQWNKVMAVWKREMMTRDQLIERFGEEVGKAVGMDRHKVANVDDDAVAAYGDVFKRAEVYEIWDKIERKVIWISSGYRQAPLDEIDDPLRLEGFFPCPRPLYGTMTTDSLVPVPDYDQYRVQAEEIDRLTQRIHILTKALKIAGAYDSALEGAGAQLSQIFNSPDNTLVPIDNWAMFAEKGGLAGTISFLPIADIAAAIQSLTAIRDQSKQDLYEISGISDIVRGQGAASETATAQSIKGQFVGMRLEDRQSAMGRFARDTERIVAEIVAEHFSPETLWDLSGWEYTEEARAMDREAEEFDQKQMAALMARAAPMNGGGQVALPSGMNLNPAPQAPPPTNMGGMQNVA